MVQAKTDSLAAEQLMQHMRVLCAEIGARPPTSRQERLAAEYARKTLEDLGIEDVNDQFFVSQDTYGWTTIPLLAVGAIAPLLGGRLGKLIGGAALLWTAKGLRDAMLARLPFFQPMVAQAASQNVIAKIAPSGEVKRRIYLIGHLDSNKQRFLMPQPARELTKPFNTLGIALAFITGALMILDGLSGRKGARGVQGWMGLLATTSLLGAFYDEAQPHVEGANDNATAVSTLLGIAAALKNQPLENTEVHLLFTGCEEVGCAGMEAYLERNQPPKDNSYFIDLEMVGTGRLGYATRHGISHFSEYRPGPHITALAAQVAHDNPALRVNGQDMLIVEETANLRSRGYESLCIVGYDDQGFLPNWHRATDTLDNIEPDTLERAARYTWALMQAIDGMPVSNG